VFATVRHRTVRTKGSLSAMTAKHVQARHRGGKNLAAIEGRKPVAESRQSVRFQNGIEVIEMPAHHAA
jgi:putative transposase